VKSLSEIPRSRSRPRAPTTRWRRRERKRIARTTRRTRPRSPVGSSCETRSSRCSDSMKLDALAYRTVKRKAAIIGEPQRGGNCALSANTGLCRRSRCRPASRRQSRSGLGGTRQAVGRCATCRGWRTTIRAVDGIRVAAEARRRPLRRRRAAGKPAAISVSITAEKAGRRDGRTAASRTIRRVAPSAVRCPLTGRAGVARVRDHARFANSAGVKGPVLRHVAGEGVLQAKGNSQVSRTRKRRALIGGRCRWSCTPATNRRGPSGPDCVSRVGQAARLDDTHVSSQRDHSHRWPVRNAIGKRFRLA